MSLEELEQEPFNAHEFVERLAWRTMGTKGRSNHDDFDPMLLHGSFEKMIQDLKEKNAQMEKKVEKLEDACKEEEKRHWQRVGDLQKRNKASYSHFQELDERINLVATKVVHLGDQLEGVNTPRARAVDAQRLMNFFNEFLHYDEPKSSVFTDPFQLQLAAEIIQKLYQIALELPVGEKFDNARKKIWDRYLHIEKELIAEFLIAHRHEDRRKMKRVAFVLSNFKGYGECVDAFIEESMKGAFQKLDPFDDVVPLCTRTSDLVTGVFSSPDTVMAKFVQTIYNTKLQKHIASKLESKEDPEEYLITLFQLYTRTMKLSEDISVFKMGNDSLFLTKLTKSIFVKHLEAYINFETKYLKERCSAHLQRYYDGKDHTKKQIQSGGLSELRRDLQAKIGTMTKTNINIGPAIENFGGETFLSQEVTISLLQEAKNAFKRCKVLSSSSDMSGNAVQIFEVLVQFLVIEHIDYAVELGLQAIPLPDPKSQPEVYFFDVVGQANTLFHLFEKQFMDSLVPLVISSPRHSLCLQRKRELREQVENKIDTGLDRSNAAITGWVRNILAAEQKKSDFKPEDNDAMQMVSPACLKVVNFMRTISGSIHSSLDGKNVEAVFTDLGTRLHRVIFDHLQGFMYNSLGAMLVICDVNEYRKSVKDFKIPMVTELFEKLHALCNLLVVVPENLKQVCSGEQLAGIDKTVLLSIIQLRTDFKSAKLANILK
ncbi:exocyst complex component 5-like [Mizuhopecten yessoensis]|uniref:Exocyst complex component 5 n=1 Tax=Mizuhopecten yessoensis TaxID=6573 RepID=A0A210QYB7_MIZYE|nr:exocyst complex component 5-like [Mizuhopecten yessoensis]OWF53753.1 Exocyst complex component 5 [Mizuhopecten yessoensis]